MMIDPPGSDQASLILIVSCDITDGRFGQSEAKLTRRQTCIHESINRATALNRATYSSRRLRLGFDSFNVS
jgi:hypothetical protein